MVNLNKKSGISFVERGLWRKVFMIFAAVTIIAAGCSQQSSSPTPATINGYDYSHRLQVGNQILFVEVAAVPGQMQQGLSGRTAMTDNQGMLFDFGDQTTNPAFWMKDMKFNLDFIWIKNNRIIFITENVQAPQSSLENLPLYYPPQPINQVLEVNAGWAEKNGIIVGDDVSLAQ